MDPPLLADTKRPRDPNMASLQSLIEHFLVENDVHPDLHDITEEDVGMWVKKFADLDVSALPRSQRCRLTPTDLGSTC